MDCKHIVGMNKNLPHSFYKRAFIYVLIISILKSQNHHIPKERFYFFSFYFFHLKSKDIFLYVCNLSFDAYMTAVGNVIPHHRFKSTVRLLLSQIQYFRVIHS